MDLFTVQPLEKQKKHVLDALARGCDCSEISGGEPLQNPTVVELVRFCAEKRLPVRIITSLICPEKTLDAVLDVGVADWLISTHGAKAETHDAIVHVPRARQFQIRRLAKIIERTKKFCMNYVLVEANQTEIADWARWVLTLDMLPTVCNVINYNPHYQAEKKAHDLAMKNVADLRVAGPLIDEAFDLLEEAGIGCNARYMPYCALSERHWKTVCSDLHVALDAGEWLNSIPNNTLRAAEQYGRQLSLRNEEKGEPCCRCGLQWICGGANASWHRMSREKFGVELLQPQPLPEGADPNDYWFYRQHNILGLDPRR
jgi:MoaA/NifB/PqqE/SkfB family radical SAM enzyme